jgi:predicted membrane-bound spermidine synthase/tetratricopeptide (TPR) repeat protein
MRRPLLGLLFLLSGAAALCYEVAWTRHLVLVFGNTTRAVALLLGAYMLGLALGSEVGGRLADRTKRPAALYGLFELAIAAFALAFPWLVDAVRAVYLGIGTAAPPVLFLLAFVLLVVPTFCMGTTLPLLARATVDDASQTGRDVGFLYAMNIVGAVAGAAGTGFVLMEAAGVLGATRWAAAVNAVVGVVGWLAFRGTGVGASARNEDGGVGASAGEASLAPTGTMPRATTGSDASDREAAASRDADAHVARVRRGALVSAFVAGFVGLAAQVVWTRLLTFFLQGFTWTFSAILGTFLAGLALGGWVFGRRATTSADPARLLVRLHLGVAVATAAALWALGRHYDVTKDMWTLAGSVTQDLGARHRLMLVLASGSVLLVPAFLMGGCFPVATALFQRGLGDLGARVGRLYAVNTVGCVLGSLVAGFVLQPVMGPAQAAAVVAVAALVGAVAVAVASGARPGRLFAAAAGVAFVALFAVSDSRRPILLRSHVFAGDRAREVELVEERHGEVCTVSVVRNVRERYTLLYTDEFEAAGTKPEYRYMRMLAHLPVALARDPSRALVICFGTGTTAGSVATHAAVKSLDIVEISPEVLDVADQFREVNHGVLAGAGRSDLAVNVHVDDGRHFVLRSDATWGVISLEPLMPYTPAAIHLYTRDFYEICRGRLAPGGLVCQWIPLQGMSGDDFRKLVAAFVAVFPDSAMFFVDGAVALIGGPDGVDLSYARVEERLSDPAVAADLRTVGFADPARALATFVSGGERLRDFVKDVAPCTDERPVLEFHPIPPGVALPWLGQNLQHMHALRSAWEQIPVDWSDWAKDPDRARQELFLALRSGNHVLDGQLRLETSVFLTRLGRRADALDELRSARESFAQAVALDPGNETARRQWESLEREWWTILGGAAIDQGDFALAERHLLRATEFRALRQADVAWTRLAEARNRAGKFEAALEAACEATRLFADGAEARAERAFARSSLGDGEGAAIDYIHAAQGTDAAALPERLRPDAERVWTAYPSPVHALRAKGMWMLRDSAGFSQTRDQLPERLRLRIQVADLGSGQFAVDLSAPAADVSDADAAARIERLRMAAPDGAATTVEAWLDSGRATVVRPAAEALVALDPRRVAELLDGAKPGPRTVELARAAAKSADVRLVRPLLRLLRSDDVDVRRAAQFSLFTLTRGEAPRIGELDVTDPASTAYRRAVLDLESWWARESAARER